MNLRSVSMFVGFSFKCGCYLAYADRRQMCFIRVSKEVVCVGGGGGESRFWKRVTATR